MEELLKLGEKLGKWNSYPLETVRLATLLGDSYPFASLDFCKSEGTMNTVTSVSSFPFYSLVDF